jgi:zona occludens toxin
MPFVLCFVVIGLAVPKVYHFFHPVEAKAAQRASESPAGGSGVVGGVSGQAQAANASKPLFSDVWRICGSFYAKSQNWVVVCNAQGATRVESPSVFRNVGLAQIGDIDGAKVTMWSGPAVSKQAAPAAPVQPAASGALGEIRK